MFISFIDHSYPNNLGFTEWPDYTMGVYGSVGMTAGPNQPVFFDFNTIAAGHRRAIIEHPPTVGPLEGDFVVDFVASRNSWDEETLLFGQMHFFGAIKIENTDGTSAEIKLGWKQLPYEGVKIFYSGVITNTATTMVIDDFYFEIDAPDDIGDHVKFRLRRVDEAVFGMFYDETLVDGIETLDGEFSRVGGFINKQPGSGSGEVYFEIGQDSSPNPGEHYACTLHNVVLDSEYTADAVTSEDDVTIGRDSLNAVDKATVTFPILLTRRTNITKATLSLTAAQAHVFSGESFNVIPYDIINADNLGTLIDYPLKGESHSFVTTFVPGDLAAGESFDIDVTSIVLHFMSQSGHLPGFYKAVSIEPSLNTNDELILTPGINLNIEYEDITTGVVFKVGSSIDPSTGIVSLHTKNILYDAVNESNRTVLNFGVYLKKSGFKNDSIKIGIKDLARIGIGTCLDDTAFAEDEMCFFIAGSTATGTFVEGPFPCYFHLP